MLFSYSGSAATVLYLGEKKKPQTTNGCTVQYVVPWEQRTNERSAPSREQQFGDINSMIPLSHFNLVHVYVLERGVGGVTWGRVEGPELLPKPGWLQRSSYIILRLCAHV